MVNRVADLTSKEDLGSLKGERAKGHGLQLHDAR